jgi:hypothetical protein
VCLGIALVNSLGKLKSRHVLLTYLGAARGPGVGTGVPGLGCALL